MNVPTDLNRLLGARGAARILVVGDLILDRYVFGNVDRVSPEAPVLVLEADAEELRPGGAASVAMLCRSLDAQVTVAGVLGEDDDGLTLHRLLDQCGIALAPVLRDPARPTTSKTRLVGRAAGRHPHQILRVDCEVRLPLSPDLEQRLAAAVVRQLDDHQSLLVSDYAKGVCTPRLLETVLTAAARQRVPIVVDPARITDYGRYRGADVLTPNRAEAEAASGLPARTPDQALAAAADLCRRAGAQAVLVTLDSQGMALAQADGARQRFSTRPRAVYDVTGAGDMVLAVLGLAASAGVALSEAAPLANLAAGLEVERPGVAPVTRGELQSELAGRYRCDSAHCTCRKNKNVPIGVSP